MTRLRWGSATDIGMVRETNQDAMLTADPLFAVADGMGGHAGGEIASATAIEILQETFKEPTKQCLLEAVRRANAKVWDRGQIDEKLHNMGTTLTVVARVQDEDTNEEIFALANVGDSRGYMLRSDEFIQVTTDHSLVEEMLAAGEIDADEAETHPRRNILTRALGVEPVVAADVFELLPKPGDRILLCSDGLVREVSDDQIASVLRRLRSPEEAAKELVNQAKTNGGHDNITVVIVDVEDDTRSGAATSAPAVSNDKKSLLRKKSNDSAPASGRDHHHRPLTARVIMFLIAVAALLVLAVGSVLWYARGTFYVGVDGEQVVIYRGRPEAVLWFKPTLVETTNIKTSDVLPNDVDRLREGTVRSSLGASHEYVRTLLQKSTDARKIADPKAAAPPEAVFNDSNTPTTAPTTTEVPTTTPPQAPEVSAARS